MLLRPRMLVDVSAVSTATTVLGTEIAMPLMVAPTSLQRVAHPDGEPALARAAASVGTVYTLSSLGSVRPAELAEGAPDALRWFQLYWSRDRDFTRDLVREAAANGFGAIVLTVDLPTAGPRERDLRSGFSLPDDLPMPNLPGRSWQRLLPRRARRGRGHEPHVARPRVAALRVRAPARRQGRPHGRGRVTRVRARRRRARRLEPRRPAARRRAGNAGGPARGGRGRRRPRRGLPRRRHPARDGRRQGARTRRASSVHRPSGALGARGGR